MNFEQRSKIRKIRTLKRQNHHFNENKSSKICHHQQNLIFAVKNVKMRSCVFSTLRNKLQHSMLYSKANKSIPHYFDLPLILLQKSKTSSSSSSPSISSTSSNDQSQSLNARSSNLQQEGLIFNVCHASYRRDFKIPFVITKPFYIRLS